jgi:hypothetical protein
MSRSSQKKKGNKPKRTPEELAALKAIKAERNARFAVIESRCADFTYPEIPAEALEFTRAFTRWHLLDFLNDALDAPAADEYLVDSGYDCSMYAQRANETNRERAARGGVSLSGLDHPYIPLNGQEIPNPLYHERATIGDLLHAPDGNTYPTYISGMGFATETWEHQWYEAGGYACESLDIPWVLAQLVLNNNVTMLENIARTPLGDAPINSHPAPLKFDGIADDVLLLAQEARQHWGDEADITFFDMEKEIDLKLPVTELPRLLMSAQRSWNRHEQLTLALGFLGECLT